MMFAENLDDENQAILSYEIYRLTRKKKDRVKATNLYKKLYKQNPDIRYKKRIKELGKQS